jgi:hypothetical protein
MAQLALVLEPSPDGPEHPHVSTVYTGALCHLFYDGQYWTTVHEDIFTNPLGKAALCELRASLDRLVSRINA